MPLSSPRRFAIVGFGCAGYHALKALRASDPEAEIDVYSEHGYAPYNPMLTTYYVAGKISEAAMFPFGTLSEIAAEFRANILSGTKVSAVDALALTVTDANGSTKKYDSVLIATGASAFVPKIENDCPEKTFVMRTVDDAFALRRALDGGRIKRAAVIGASMTGIKVAELLMEAGAAVTLADMAEHIFPLAAYPETARRIEKALSEKGLALRFGAALKAIKKSGDGIEVVFDGGSVPADIAVLCIGTRANISLLAGQVKTDRGIISDNSMQTSAPGVFAAGDCCQAKDIQLGAERVIALWANAAAQGEAAGYSMAGARAENTGSFLHNISHFMDMDFVGLGDCSISGERHVFETEKYFIEAVTKDGLLAGANLLGCAPISGIVKNCLLRSAPITEFQAELLRREGIPDGFTDLLKGGR